MRAELMNNQIIIFDSFVHKETIKQMPGRMWDTEQKAWIVPADLDNIITLGLIGCKLDKPLTEMLQSDKMKNTGCQGGPPKETMPVKVTPYAHQIIGFNKACEIMGIFEGR